MKPKSTTTICFLLLSSISYAQWEVSLGPGITLPITGYGEVVNSGWTLDAEGKYRIKKTFAVGLKAQFTRLQKDKDANDAFVDSRFTIAPLLFTAEYGNFLNGSLQPSLTAGIGISFFNINYGDTLSPQTTALNNVSFTMMPQIGLRYAASKNVFPFIESGLILIADGPPISFPKSDQITGYAFITAGVLYRFK